MSRFLTAFWTLLLASLALSGAFAQNGQPQFGDPPVAALISVSAPDADGLVTISGASGAVFPASQVAIRNLYTEDTVYVQAGVTGTFTARLYGPGNTPFWISPAPRIPNELRDRPGSLPGGPGTIIYGPFPETAPAGIVTQIRVDGDLSDWQTRYADAELLPQPVYALVNQDALFVGLAGDDLPAGYAQMVLTFTLDGALYTLALDPRVPQPALLRRIQPREADLGTLLVGAAQRDNGVEVRVPFLPINPNNTAIEVATLERIQFLGADGAEALNLPVEQPVAVLNEERSGAAHPNSALGENFTRFTVSGPVAQGAGMWQARGRINTLDLQPGAMLVLELDITLNAAQLPADLVDLRMLGQLGLQPVIGPDGRQATGGLNSNNGWSNLLTPGGLPVINLTGDVTLGEATAPPATIIRQNNQLVFALDFALELPDDLPAGRYVPVFRGFGQVADGEPFAWETNNLFGAGAGISRQPLTRLPLVLTVGTVDSARLLWTLFQDAPSAGSRGLLADEDRAAFGLSNRVRFDAPTYILPRATGADGAPIAYPLEPYLLNQLPNAYDTTAAPLVPFLFPGGRLSARVTRPDGTVDDLGSAPIVQNRLSTAALDESVLFGAQSLVDVYRLTTLNPLFTSYVFDSYGDYRIELTGSVEDTWGNRYDGGGTYHVRVAEPLQLLPGVLPGTPFEVGNVFYPGLRVLPGGAAEVTITARIYPLDGGNVIEQVITGTANRYGYFYAPDGAFTFETPGEYVVDYEARYTDTEGKLWAASLRSAGVIANPGGTLVARGQRGLDGAQAELRPAWFALNRYLTFTTGGANWRLNYPYNTGDVVWIAPDNPFNPVIQVQDRQGDYAGWLQTTQAGRMTPAGLTLEQAAAEDELPVGVMAAPDDHYGAALLPDRITNDAYFYISAVRPDVAARQFVAGGREGGLPLYWDWNDPFNGQAGTGISGSREGDYVFLYGGAVVRNDEAGVHDASIYAALAITIDPDDPQGPRVFPPYRGTSGTSGGALLVLNDQPVEMFFHPTGIQPGQTLTVGDTLAVAGQVAPTLPSTVAVTVTSPGGQVRQFAGTANAIGYFYNPANDVVVDEAGVWTVDITVQHEGQTSAGPVEPPLPTGGVLGTVGGRFEVYVLPEDATALNWNDGAADISIPAGFPYNFNVRFPVDWSDVQIYHTVTTPAYVLDMGPVRSGGAGFTYQYNPTNLSRVFPNLENNGEGDGAQASDIVTVTLVVTGTDANGRPQIQSRSFTILHDRLTTFDE
ncbi:MAG: hypothetical protein HZC41_11815 [Chloroflexi bacterium]|nr:hypothetical protein [Chloroflexota bacterium]